MLVKQLTLGLVVSSITVCDKLECGSYYVHWRSLQLRLSRRIAEEVGTVIGGIERQNVVSILRFARTLNSV